MIGHMMLARVIPEFALSEDEAQNLGEAICNYLRHTKVKVDPKIPEYKATALYKFWRLKCGDKLNLSPLGQGKPLDEATNKQLLDLLATTIAEMKTRYGKWDVAWGDVHKVGRGGVYFPVGAVLLWSIGQLAVLGPALRAAAVPPVVATRSV